MANLMLEPNIGTADRILRIAAGIILLSLVAMQAIGLWGLVGLVPLLTGLVRFCPLYSVLGIRTCPARRA